MNKEKFFKFCFGCPPSVFSKAAIVTPFLPLKRFRELGDVIADFKGQIYSGTVISRNGKKVTVIRCGMGSQFMGDAVLLLNETPVEKIVFAGTCGGLKDCGIGDFIICESAFDGEGFSRYYTKDFAIKTVLDSNRPIPADPEYTEKLAEFVTGRLADKNSLKKGDVFTIGSIMAENKETLLSMEEEGFKGIDLELSSVYHAARVIGRKIAGLLFVSDLPLKKPLGEELTASEKDVYDRGFEELVHLSTEFVSMKEG